MYKNLKYLFFTVLININLLVAISFELTNQANEPVYFSIGYRNRKTQEVKPDKSTFVCDTKGCRATKLESKNTQTLNFLNPGADDDSMVLFLSASESGDVHLYELPLNKNQFLIITQDNGNFKLTPRQSTANKPLSNNVSEDEIKYKGAIKFGDKIFASEIVE